LINGPVTAALPNANPSAAVNDDAVRAAAGPTTGFRQKTRKKRKKKNQLFQT